MSTAKKKVSKNWVKISDDKVKSIWKCRNPKCEEYDAVFEISPTFYEAAGIPMCGSCAENLAYFHTLILAK